MLNLLKSDLKQAMKEKDVIKKNIIQLVKANIINLAIERKVPEDKLTNEDILDIISKELKQQNDSLEAFKSGNRLDLVKETEMKIEVLKGYLPKQLTEDEIRKIVIDTMKELDINSPNGKEKGLLMKNLMPKVKGKADGKLVNQIVSSIK